jgi:hypothetical protein
MPILRNGIAMLTNNRFVEATKLPTFEKLVTLNTSTINFFNLNI